MAKTKPPVDVDNSPEDVVLSVDDSPEDVVLSVDDSPEDVVLSIDDSLEDISLPVDDSPEDVTPTVYVVMDSIRHDGTQYAAGDELTDLLDLQASVLVACGVIKPKAD